MGACCVNQMKLAFFIAISARPFPGMRHDRAFSVDKVFRLPDRLLEFSFGKVFCNIRVVGNRFLMLGSGWKRAG